MTLIELDEWRTPRVIVRLAACDCAVIERETGQPGLCGTRILFCSVPGAHESLWIASVIGPASDITAAADALRDPETDLGAVVETALALVGLPWSAAAESRESALTQAGALHRVPGWMLRLPRGVLWATRGCTFGPDLTRVPRALWALHRAYVPDGDVPSPVFMQGWEWGKQPVEGPALEPWS